MNIFYLSQDIDECVRFHNDKHVVKMILESGQILSTSLRIKYDMFNTIGSNVWVILPKATHAKHPCVQWVLKNRAHYEYLYDLFKALLAEYTYRYGKKHSWEQLVNVLDPVNFDKLEYTGPFEAPPLCMPDKYKAKVSTLKLLLAAVKREAPISQIDRFIAVSSYRAYYIGEKLHFSKYTKREWPAWLPKQLTLKEVK